VSSNQRNDKMKKLLLMILMLSFSVAQQGWVNNDFYIPGTGNMGLNVIEQLADGAGFEMYGFDDKSAEYFKIGVNGAGHTNALVSQGFLLQTVAFPVDIEFRTIGNIINKLNAAATGTYSFNIINSAVTTLFEVLDNGNTTVAGSLEVGSLVTPYQQTLTVAKSGGDYATIQGAIDAITDNATDKRYMILVYPGVYTENVVMEEYVSLVGHDHEITEITSVSGVTVTAPSGASDASISNLKLSSTPTADGATVLVQTAGELDVYDCYVKMTSSTAGVNGELVDVSGGELDFVNTTFTYDMDGTSAGAENHNIFYVSSGTVVYNIHDSHFDIDVADVDDTIIAINEAAGSTITEDIIKNCIFHLNASNVAYSGTAGLFYLHGAGAQKNIENNHVHVTSDGNGTGYIIYMDTTAGSGVINSIGNWGEITGFTNNYAGNTGAGDTINGSFVRLSAASGTTGAGTFNTVAVAADGSLIMTGYIGDETIQSSGTEFAVKQVAAAAGSNSHHLSYEGVTSGGAREFDTYMDADAGTDTYRLITALNGGGEALSLDEAGNFSIKAGVLKMTERAAQVATVATEGEFWVKNDAPTAPMFTDDDGDDHQILTSLDATLMLDSIERFKINSEPPEHSSSGIILDLTAGEVLNIGDVGYQNADGEIYLADATDATKMPGLFMCVETAADGVESAFLQVGVMRDDTWNWTVGGLIYLTITGTTGNTLSQTAPIAAGEQVQVVGMATHADRMTFTPSLVLVTI